MSVLVHGLLIAALFLAAWLRLLDWESAGPAGDPLLSGGGGGGGRAVRAVALPGFSAARPAQPAVQQTAEVTPEPVPTPVPVEELLTAPEPDVQIAATVPDTLIGAPDAGRGGSGSGGGMGSGRGTGEGSGTGPGSGSGSGGGEGAGGPGSGGAAPVPRQVILPPLDYPRTMRGQRVAVTFWVGTDGRVRRVELEPEIADRGFAKRFRDVMMQYRFRPARSPEGTPIAGTTTVTIAF